MKKVKTIYTIRYSKSGINQYAKFYYDEQDQLISKQFNPSYVKISEIPSLDNLTKIEDILEVIKAFSFNGKHAEIWMINNQFPEIHKNETLNPLLAKQEEIINAVIRQQSLEFFNFQLLPLFQKNNWRLNLSYSMYPTIFYNKDGEWEEVSTRNWDFIILDSLCNRFVNQVLGAGISLKREEEQNYWTAGESLNKFFSALDNSDIEHSGVYQPETEN